MRHEEPTRRRFLKRLSLPALMPGLFAAGGLEARAEGEAARSGERGYHQFGRTADDQDLRVIDPGLKITRIETFTKGQISVVRVRTDSGAEGVGQIATYDADISALVLHRRIARHFLGSDPADLETLVDRSLERNLKYPWSFVCRALGGIETAIWDLYGKLKKKPVCELLGGEVRPFPVYGSSMRRDINGQDEAERLRRLMDTSGFRAFKVRVGTEAGRNRDQWPGRSEEVVKAVRAAIGPDTKLLVDGNSCYTPDNAIEIGRMLEGHGVVQFEEPCPYWELEWTAEVAEALELQVSGGEQDNDLAQWRRMIEMDSVDIVQPDILYLGGVARTLRVARMAEQAGKPCVPHSANVSLVTVFTLHLMAAIPNAGAYVELSIEDRGIAQEAIALYRPSLQVTDGKVPIPAGPGWGVEVDPDWLASAERTVSAVS
jgi:L-alanine-DL-glutamate epimerase-like enolase superfamily enzyme